MITFPWLSKTSHRTLRGNVFQNKQQDSCITSWRCEINSKHWEQLSQVTVLMHDNAHSHTAGIPQPPYSKIPGISTIQPWHCIEGYYLFGPFKMLHQGCPLVANHDLKKAVHVCLPPGCIQKLEQCWTSLMNGRWLSLKPVQLWSIFLCHHYWLLYIADTFWLTVTVLEYVNWDILGSSENNSRTHHKQNFLYMPLVIFTYRLLIHLMFVWMCIIDTII